MTNLRMTRRAQAAVRAVFVCASLVAGSGEALADTPSPPGSGIYAELNAGPVFATFLPIDPGGTDSEHLVTGASQLNFGAGYGWELPRLRLDVGVRVQHVHMAIAGNYSLETRDDDFRANYDYIAPALSASVTTRRASRVNLFAGLSLGTATFVSDKQGKPLKARQTPVFGSFEAGLVLQLTDWLDARGSILWVPPVTNLNVLAPQLGLRTRF
jgi:hypothetical protein